MSILMAEQCRQCFRGRTPIELGYRPRLYSKWRAKRNRKRQAEDVSQVHEDGKKKLKLLKLQSNKTLNSSA